MTLDIVAQESDLVQTHLKNIFVKLKFNYIWHFSYSQELTIESLEGEPEAHLSSLQKIKSKLPEQGDIWMQDPSSLGKTSRSWQFILLLLESKTNN